MAYSWGTVGLPGLAQTPAQPQISASRILQTPPPLRHAHLPQWYQPSHPTTLVQIRANSPTCSVEIPNFKFRLWRFLRFLALRVEANRFGNGHLLSLNGRSCGVAWNFPTYSLDPNADMHSLAICRHAYVVGPDVQWWWHPWGGSNRCANRGEASHIAAARKWQACSRVHMCEGVMDLLQNTILSVLSGSRVLGGQGNLKKLHKQVITVAAGIVL